MKIIGASAAKNPRSLCVIRTNRRLSSTTSLLFRRSRTAQRTDTRRMLTRPAPWNTKRSWWSSMITKISERIPRKCIALFASEIFFWPAFQEIEKISVPSIRHRRHRPVTLPGLAGNSTWYQIRRRCRSKILSGKPITNSLRKECIGNHRQAIRSRPSCMTVSMSCVRWTSEARPIANKWTNFKTKTTSQRSITEITLMSTHCITEQGAHLNAINTIRICRMTNCHSMTSIVVNASTTNRAIISGKSRKCTAECTRIFHWASYQTKDP